MRSVPSASPVSVSSRHLVLAIAALALGGFGIGVTEFSVMGLLPEIAKGLDSDEASVGTAISSYALGVVIGAPLITALGARIPRKWLLMGIMALFVLGNALSMVAPTMSTFETARFVAGLPHGAFFGVAAVTAASMVSLEKRGRAISSVFLGLTIANVLGVPAATWLGQNFGWRSAFLVVVVIGVLTVLAVLALVPHGPVRSDASIGRELSALQSRQIWIGLAIGAIGFAGIFCVFSYISPIATTVSGLSSSLIPVVLVLFGLGMTFGAMTGGRLSDWSVDRAIPLSLAAMAVVLVFFALTAQWSWAAFVGAFIIGFSSQLLNAPLQIRLMDAAPQAPALAAAINQSAFNMANAIGAAAGGFVISAGAPLIAPAWVGAAFAVAGLIIALTAARVVVVGRRRYQVDTHTGSIAIIPLVLDPAELAAAERADQRGTFGNTSGKPAQPENLA